MGIKFNVRRFREEEKDRDDVSRNIEYSSVRIILWYVAIATTIRIRRVHYKSLSYPRWSLHIKNMYLSLSQACFTTIRGSSEFGRNNSIRVTFASIHKHDVFIICMHDFLRVYTYVYVKVHTETDRTWDTYRLHNTNISRKIKRNRAGLLLAELCASTFYLQSFPFAKCQLLCRRHLSRGRTVSHVLMKPTNISLSTATTRLGKRFEWCVDSEDAWKRPEVDKMPFWLCRLRVYIIKSLQSLI